MITVNSISGGKTSAYLAKHYPANYDVFSLVCIKDKECAPKDPSIIKYVNDKLEKYTPKFGEFIATAEDNKTLYVMRDIEQFIGREITWVRGEDYDDIIDLGKEGVLPSWARRYCTERMKLLPIFMWWFYEIGVPIKMRIGFRHDEFERMLRFFNNSNPSEFSIPVACSTKGQKRQRHEIFKWRFCDMPLVKDGIDHLEIRSYWANKYIGGTLEQPYKKIEFPEISNCAGCFHKKDEVIMLEYILNPKLIEWFARQEEKDMGTWRDDKVTYRQLIERAKLLTVEEIDYLKIKYLRTDGSTCDTGGCTD